jgi:FecR protein
MRHAQTFLRFLALTGALLTVSGVNAPLQAQDPDDLKRGVARISLINGDVNVRRGDSGDWVAGVINAPLLTDDRIATGPNSRAEVQFDASNALRIGANADLHLAQLEYGRYQMELGRGTATFRSLRAADVNIEIDTPTISVRPSRQGSVRIAVSESGETEVTARNGDVEIFTPRGSQWIHTGQTMLARGSASDPEFQIVSASPLDDWDRWCESRDRMILQSDSSRYVGPGIYGAEELDGYGTWESVPEYGYVWRPTVAVDWAPYHYGRWSWVDWYGWTWVSADPWGWAPYHYGRWFHHDRFGWCWYPGVVTARHYWSPALVAFVGFGGGGGVGFGFGNVGWVPLAPYEVYHPWWGRSWYRSGGYVNRQVNIVNVNITNVYRNSRFNGVSAVGFHDFQNGRFNNVGRFNGTQIREAGLIRGQMPFTPGGQNLRFSDRNIGNVPRVNDNGRFFRHQSPNPVQRVPFAQQVRAEGNSGPQGNGFRGGQSTDGQGWRRFGSPSGQSGGFMGGGNRPGGQAMQQPPARTDQIAPRQQNRGGWQRFGSPGSGGSASNPQSPPANRNDGRGFVGGGFGQRPSQAQPQPQPQAPRQNFQEQGAPRNFGAGRQFGNSGRPENLRISPPVVRERPNYQGGSRSNGPVYRQSAPNFSAPRQSAPAPRSNGGGGSPRGYGGGGHSGGGGGGHSGGGGNRRGR